MSKDLKTKVAKGAFWVLMERFSAQIVTFGVSIALARLLSPSDYGTVALLGIFIAVANVLADSGFGNALIQKKNATDLDFNSVFYVSLAISAVVYIILFSIAPLASRFYKVPELCPILRVSSISVLFNAVNSVQNAELSRKMLFHLSFRISLISTVASAICGLTLALLGFGAWTLVWANLASAVAGVISRWFIIAWRPSLAFSWEALKPLLAYGWKLLCSGLLSTIYNNLHGLIIGRWYSKEDLSFVNKGRTLPDMLMGNIDRTLSVVAFPALSQMQDDKVKLREAMRRMMVVSTFFIFPLMMLFAITAKNTILFLYGEKWLPSVPYAMIACISFAMWPFHTVNLQAIQAMGRSDVFLKLEIIKKVVAFTVLFVCLSQSVLIWCLAGALVLTPVSMIVNSWPNKELLGYSLRMQVADVMPTVAVCAAVSVPVLLLNLLPCDYQFLRLAVLLAQGLTGVLLFASLSVYFRIRGAREIAAICKPRVLGRFPQTRWFFDYLEK